MPVIGSPTYDQKHCRFYNDDGSESAGTAWAAEDTNITMGASDSSLINLRLGVSSTGANSTTTPLPWRLQYRKNGGTWTNITTSSSNVKAVNSSNLTDGGATTNRLTVPGGLTFSAGLVSEDGLADDQATLVNKFYEFLFALQVIKTDLTNGDTLEFRLLCNSGVLNTYTVILMITLSIPASGGLYPAYLDPGHTGGMINMGGM